MNLRSGFYEKHLKNINSLIREHVFFPVLDAMIPSLKFCANSFDVSQLIIKKHLMIALLLLQAAGFSELKERIFMNFSLTFNVIGASLTSLASSVGQDTISKFRNDACSSRN